MKVHSSILAIVLSIFLIQATDPPHDGNSGSLIENSNIALFLRKNDTINALQTRNTNGKGLEVLQHYLTQIKGQTINRDTQIPKDESSRYHAINRFLQRKGKTEYERLLEKDFVRPLLKLYQNQHSDPISSSKQGISPEQQPFSNEQLAELINHYNLTEKTVDVDAKQSELKAVPSDDLKLLINQESVSIRRDDNFETIDVDPANEHIGEILPSNYNADVHRINHKQFFPSPSRRNYHLEEQYRKPIRFQDDRFRPEYEPTSVSSDGYDLYHYGRPEAALESNIKEERQVLRPTRVNLPPSEVPGYRLPRRLRGFREILPEILQSTGRDQYFETKPQKQSWQGAWGARRPRVIFPSDLVAFREPAQDEPDWLASDSNLQDLQETDTRDRGSFFV